MREVVPPSAKCTRHQRGTKRQRTCLRSHDSKSELSFSRRRSFSYCQWKLAGWKMIQQSSIWRTRQRRTASLLLILVKEEAAGVCDCGGGPLHFVRTCQFTRETMRFRHARGAGLRLCSLLEMWHWYLPCISRRALAERAGDPPFIRDSNLIAMQESG